MPIQHHYLMPLDVLLYPFGSYHWMFFIQFDLHKNINDLLHKSSIV